MSNGRWCVVVLFSGTGCVVVGVLQSRAMDGLDAHRRGQAMLPIQWGHTPLAVFSSSSFFPSPIESNFIVPLDGAARSACHGNAHCVWACKLFYLRSCLVGFLALTFGPKSQEPNQRGCFWRVLFQKQLLFRSSFLKAGLILLLAFGFLLFKIGGIKSSSIVVSREIKTEGIFYTCLTKQFLTFL